MTQQELWAFVEAVRTAKHALSDADSALYGIFGHGDDSSTRDYKIRVAKRRFADAQPALETLKEFV